MSAAGGPGPREGGPIQHSRRRALAPNMMTAANIACGFAAMVAAADGRFEVSVYLLLLAIICDTLDGTVARLLGATSKFGQELDSFSDAISFGVAPALLLYLALLRPLGPWSSLVSLAYLLAGIFRLIRFNLASDAHVKDRHTLGLPIPIAASYIMAAVLIRHELESTTVIVLTLAMAALMVSRVRLPNLKGRNHITAMLLVGVVNYLAVVAWPSWTTIIWWNVWNLFILVAAWMHDRRLGLETATGRVEA